MDYGLNSIRNDSKGILNNVLNNKVFFFASLKFLICICVVYNISFICL